MYYQFYERNIDFAKQEPHHFLREMQRKNNSLVFCTLNKKRWQNNKIVDNLIGSRGQPGLNRWPLDLPSNALPLSYAPKWQQNGAIIKSLIQLRASLK